MSAGREKISCRFIADVFVLKKHSPGGMPMPAAIDGDAGPMHQEIMSELRALRAQMAGAGRSVATRDDRRVALARDRRAHALLETYRAQIGQCEKLKVELGTLNSRRPIQPRPSANRGPARHTSFNGEEMAKVNGELGAVVGGTEEGDAANSGGRGIDRPGGDRAVQDDLAGSAKDSQRWKFRSASFRSSRPAISRI